VAPALPPDFLLDSPSNSHGVSWATAMWRAAAFGKVVPSALAKLAREVRPDGGHSSIMMPTVWAGMAGEVVAPGVPGLTVTGPAANPVNSDAANGASVRLRGAEAHVQRTAAEEAY
jgi:hypothetical protein